LSDGDTEIFTIVDKIRV